jgi:hypothetical protein
MRIWIDTEFNEYHGALISMALVADNGSEWYGVRFCDDPGWWVREHVMPHLLQQPERDADLRTGLAEFLGQFDVVHIVSDWPGDIAHFCNFLEYAPGERIGPDTMTFEVRRDLPDTATTSAIPHNALEDARALARSVHLAKSEAKNPLWESRVEEFFASPRGKPLRETLSATDFKALWWAIYRTFKGERL